MAKKNSGITLQELLQRAKTSIQKGETKIAFKDAAKAQFLPLIMRISDIIIII